MIRLSHVFIPEETAERVKQLVLAGQVGQSEIIEEFEEAFAWWVGSKYAVAVSSGTMADTISLAVLKHFFPGKNEVLVPALTFIAQVNSIVYNGLRPVFYDTDIEAVGCLTEKTLCFFPVHLLGNPSLLVDGGQWMAPLVEDSCEAMGSFLNERKCGSLGDLGTFSFFPSHTITTGEGGMIVTDNEDYAKLARRLRNHGKINSHDFHFDVIGFNGKMTSLQAAIGLGFLKEIDQIIEKRRKAYFALGGTEREGGKVSPHAFPFMCESEDKRDRMMENLRKAGIECRNLFSSIPTQEKAYAYLGHKPGAFPMAEDVGRRGLYVPCHQGLTDEDIAKIKDVLSEA